MSILDNYKCWLAHTQTDVLITAELTAMAGDGVAMEDAFYREFGTGGLRGVLGDGSNRMNVYTVAKATQGYANYLLHEFTQPTMAIGYDSRINSTLFAQTAAIVFAPKGILVHLYSQLMLTPAHKEKHW